MEATPRSTPKSRACPRLRWAGWAALVAVAACGSQPKQSGWPEKSLGEVAPAAFALDRPAIAIDGGGHPAVAYVDDHAALLVRAWDGATWVQVGEALNAAGISAAFPALTLDQGALAVAWEESTSEGPIVRAARFEGGTWTPLAGQVNATGSIAQRPRIVSGSQGLVVAYRGGPSAAAVVSLWSGNTWRDWLPTAGQNATGIDLTLLPDGSPAVSWIESSWEGSVVQNQAATQFWSASSGAWTSLPRIDLQNSASTFVAADTDGALFLATHDASPSLQPIRRVRPGTGAWEEVGVPDQALRSEGPLVALPGSGIAVAFSAGGTWYVARYAKSSWGVVATIAGQPLALAAATDGTLYVAWWAAAPNGTFSAPIETSGFKAP